MWKISTFLLIVIISFLSVGVTHAQTSISSPYSAYGLGNLSEVNNVKSRSMGGVGIALRDNHTINFRNPASYSAFDSTSFVFDAGIKGHYITLKTNDISQNYTSGTLSHLLFGFPVTDWWRSSFGLLPYSIVGYDVHAREHIEFVGNTKYIFEGYGGISQVYWGNSIRPFKNLSIGVNFSYLFGTMDQVQKVTFPDSLNLISTITNNAVSVNNLYFDFGAQFHKKIKKLNLTVGVTYNPKAELSARRNVLVRSYLGEISGVPIIMDTVKFVADEPGKVIVPEGFGVGFSLSNKEKWLVSAEYKYDGWESFRSFGESDSLTNRHVFKVGGQYTPYPNSLSYVQKINYRVGANYYQSQLNLRNEQINGLGITFGVGLPVISNALRRAYSMVNIGFEIGRRGTLNNDLIQENYYNLYLSISIYEWWFFKRRYK